jgi:hypothetical protein
MALHLLSANLLIPKFIFAREYWPRGAYGGNAVLELAVGGIGLLLAVPLTAFAKLVADCHPTLLPMSNLLAERPRAIPRWVQASGATVTRVAHSYVFVFEFANGS